MACFKRGRKDKLIIGFYDNDINSSDYYPENKILMSPSKHICEPKLLKTSQFLWVFSLLNKHTNSTLTNFNFYCKGHQSKISVVSVGVTRRKECIPTTT